MAGERGRPEGGQDSAGGSSAAGASNGGKAGTGSGGRPGTGKTCLHPSDVTLSTANDVAQLAAEDCEILEGGLNVYGGSITSLSGLETIKKITGALRVNDTKLADFSGLSGLSEVGDALVFSNDKPLGDLTLPALTQVGGDLVFDVPNGVTSFDAPKLELVTGGLVFAVNGDLQSIRLDSLRSAKQISIQSNPVLTTFHGFPALTSVSTLTVLDNPKLPQCEVAALDSRLHACSTCSGNDTKATCN
jgi:hypothetical protein